MRASRPRSWWTESSTWEQRFIWITRISVIWCMLWGLSACGTPLEIDQDSVSFGGSSPEIVIERFFEDLNLAFQDPDIVDPDTRRIWAERLSRHFAPSERLAQRVVLGQGLRTFASGLLQLADDQQLTTEITYDTLERVAITSTSATVRVVNGKIRMQRVRIVDQRNPEILFTQERPLSIILGEDHTVLPVVQVNGYWFMTER